MTNQEWLATLPAEEFYDQFKAIEAKGKWTTHTRLYVIDWLNEKHEEEEKK